MGREKKKDKKREILTWDKKAVKGERTTISTFGGMVLFIIFSKNKTEKGF